MRFLGPCMPYSAVTIPLPPLFSCIFVVDTKEDIEERLYTSMLLKKGSAPIDRACKLTRMNGDRTEDTRAY